MAEYDEFDDFQDEELEVLFADEYGTGYFCVIFENFVWCGESNSEDLSRLRCVETLK